MVKYRTIVADPPWEYNGMPHLSHRGSRDKWSSSPLPYSSMTLAEIRHLPIAHLADPTGCRLFLWVTNRYLPNAFPLLDHWEFTYRQTLVWMKPPSTTGGSVARINSEFLVIATMGQPTRTGTWPVSVISAAQVYRRGVNHGPLHSAKPDVFLDLVEQVSPGPYLELFARRNRLGWDTWGNESLEHVRLA